WRLETLALLSQIGCVTLPSGLLLKVSSAKVLTDDEAEQFKQHPEVGSQLLANIPRMEEVAECVKYQEKHFDGTGAPQGKHTGTEIPLGARLLKAVLDFDQWRAAGLTPEQALAMMTQHADRYDPQVLGGLVQAFSQPTDRVIMEVSVTQLTDEMFLASDVQIRDGVLLVCEGQQTTNSVRQHLQRFWKAKSIDEMVRVTMAPTAEVAA
ncbi:MAG: response regulator RpfG family c-di-GMP phosphodiesterase, partial [Candidatus Binatia bacterium]